VRNTKKRSANYFRSKDWYCSLECPWPWMKAIKMLVKDYSNGAKKKPGVNLDPQGGYRTKDPKLKRNCTIGTPKRIDHMAIKEELYAIPRNDLCEYQETELKEATSKLVGWPV